MGHYELPDHELQRLASEGYEVGTIPAPINEKAVPIAIPARRAADRPLNRPNTKEKS